MTPVTCFAGKTVALFGLGGSGLVTALALKAGGALVIACDDNPAKNAEAQAKGIEIADLRHADWSRFSSLILSPGVPLTHPQPHWSVPFARAVDVEIIGDIELFCRERAKIAPNAPFIAITGTNGKSTTTALVAHILRAAGHDVQMGGNIGTAILSLAPPSDERIHVIECSSFQIDLAPSLAPSIGVLLNISPDHLDRHGTMKDYAAIKERLVTKAVLPVICIDDPQCIAIAEKVAGDRNVLTISTCRPASMYVDGARIISGGMPFASLNGIRTLRGQHNAENAAAACAVAVALGIQKDAVASALGSFPGLPHRMEEVGRYAGAIFINDSKATNADSTEKALRSFDDVYWILGGKAKEGGIGTLSPYFSKIRKAYLIGAATEEFAASLEGQVDFVRASTLDRAVELAAADVLSSQAREPVVLLSPASASYDQYPNFEIRGNHFRELVKALPGIEPATGA